MGNKKNPRHATGISKNGNGNGTVRGGVGVRTRRIPRVDAARATSATRAPKGRLILIGGAEDREGEMAILQQVAARARGGRLAVITAASSEPAQMWSLYRKVFDTLGVKDVVHVEV